MSAIALKHIHLTTVGLSIILFLGRGLYVQALGRKPASKLLRVLPHVIDTALLASALALAFAIGQYPFVHGWLTAKFFALVAYIALGVIALDVRRPASVRVPAFVAALGVFGYIVAVALSKEPLPI